MTGGPDAAAVVLRWPGRAPADAEPARAEAPSEGTEAPTEPAFAEVVSSQPARPLDLEGSSISHLLNAYERLGSRLLARLRDMREDVDAELADLRGELAALRTGVEDVADRVQLRQLRATVDELRNEVASLRRAVLEQPELERISEDLAALRADAAEAREAAARARGADAAPDAPPAIDVDALTAAVRGPLQASLDEVESLRAEMTLLRRRISLRVAGTTLTPEELEAIAEAVTQRLLQSFRPA